MNRIPLILNVDTGIDDAFAILLAASADCLDLLAITTSFGNNTVEKTTENTLKIVELLGLRVPVAAGAAGGMLPQLRSPVLGSAAQGEDGLGGKSGQLPPPSVMPSEESAVALMAEMIRRSANRVVIVSTCALTNVAALLLAHPELKQKIDGIAFSGGAVFAGNVLPTVEANMLADPEAAEIVFRSGVKLLMCGLDATGQAYVTFEDRERMRYIETRPAAFLHAALQSYADHYENLLLQEGSALHDAVPVLWLIHPPAVATAPYFVRMDLNGRYTRGATVVDTGGLSKSPPNAAVALSVDRKEFNRVLLDGLRKFR